MALHPLVRTLRSTDLSRLDEAGVARVFDAADKAGVTPAERQLLVSTWQSHARQWPTAVREAYVDRYRSAPVGPRALGGALSGPDAEDLSSRMKTVWMANLSDPVQASYAADLARLGPQLGFQLQLSLPVGASIAGLARGLVARTGMPIEKLDQVVDVVPEQAFTSVWGEDNKILANAADPTKPVKVVVPPDISDRTLSRAEAFTADEGYHPFRPGFQGAVDQRREPDAAVEKAGRLGREVVRGRAYIEGGNLLTGVTSDGKPFGLLGRDSVVITAFHLLEKGGVPRRELDEARSRLRSAGQLDDAAIEKTARKLIGIEGGWGTRLTADRLARGETFLALLEVARNRACEDLGLDPERLVVLTQPEFHIDMHMRPMAPGEVLVNRPEATMAALEEAYRDPEATDWQRREMVSMYRNAQTDARELGPVYDQIFDELRGAGLIPIAAPGVFHGSTRQANFMNGVPGTTDAGELYYLTNASSIRPLEKVFAGFMAKLGVARTELLGGEGAGARTLSASEQSLELAGGLDCREVDHAGRLPPKNDLQRALRGLV